MNPDAHAELLGDMIRDGLGELDDERNDWGYFGGQVRTRHVDQVGNIEVPR